MFDKIYIDKSIDHYTYSNITNNHNNIGLLILTYNRIEYIKIMLNTLKNSILQDIIILIIDDNSNQDTINIIKDFNIIGVPIIKIFKNKNCGIGHSMKIGWNILQNLKVEFICNLDSDVHVRKDWLITLQDVYNKIYNKHNTYNFILSGFNYRKEEFIYDEYFTTPFTGGINLFFHKFLLRLLLNEENVLLDNIWDANVCNFMKKNNYPLFITSKCIIQHFGRDGYTGRHNYIFSYNYIYDIDENFYFKPNIEYIDKTEFNINSTIEELKKICLKDNTLLAFNTNGYIKRHINLKNFNLTDITKLYGTYIKKSYLQKQLKYKFNF